MKGIFKFGNAFQNTQFEKYFIFWNRCLKTHFWMSKYLPEHSIHNALKKYFQN